MGFPGNMQCFQDLVFVRENNFFTGKNPSVLFDLRFQLQGGDFFCPFITGPAAGCCPG